ncbi:hypothetical protein [Pseudomonas sp. S5D5]|uniref:hypothetical protein n=1 Tax=Pseudomonas sp. S5D5 TaxID=2083056 RepID=UPI0013001C24|nr:hypothetical protein [Pseudomonas sp. S5D5]
MEIDTFAQCLNYLGLAQNKKTTVELLIPGLSSLVGVIAGASITMLREKNKEKSTLKNKKMCITEELNRTKDNLEHIFKEAIRIHDDSVKEHIIPGHQLRLEISLPFVSEHFTSIAHKYSIEQRSHIIQLSEIIKEVNQQLQEFHALRNPSNFSGSALTSLNIISATIHCHRILDLIEGAKFKHNKLAIIELSDKLKISSPYVETLRSSLDKTKEKA